MILDALAVPVVQAPLAGGPSTPALAAAVSEAGGFGFLAGAYLKADALAEQLREARERTRAPFGVNLFVPSWRPAPPEAVTPYRERIAPDAERRGVELGPPRTDDDDFPAKLDVLREDPPAVVSFTFACPEPAVLEDLRARGSETWVTVTSPEEARHAAEAGADALVLQGAEAGGHQGAWEDDDERERYGVLALLQLVAEREELPLVAAGGIATRRGVAAVLAAGARAAQVGTAFMRCPEAGTADVHREALASEAPTVLTRAFSGRLARGVANAFAREHSAAAPRAYPEIHYVTAPLRAAARKAGDPEVINLWAGQAHALARPLPAAEVVRALAP